MKLIIKPEFDKKLKKLRVKTRFLNNLKREPNTWKTLYFLNKCDSFMAFIFSAFSWGDTPEGNDYWHEISKK